MIQQKKYFSLYLLMILFSSNKVLAVQKDPNLGYAGLTLLASGAMVCFVDKAGENKTIKSIANGCGTSPDDVARILGMSGGFLALSFFDKTNQKAHQKFAYKAPLAALVAGVTFTKTFQEIARRIPVVGSYIVCKNEECEGICEKCKLSKAVVAIGVYKVVDSLLPDMEEKP